MSCVSCLLDGSEILGPLFNTLTADHMYSCQNWQEVTQQTQRELSSKPSTFSWSFIAFSKPTKDFEDLEKKITFGVLVCPKLLIPKNKVTWMP